jgi:formate dehydrogenase iron-sulfur subunit
MALTHEPHGFYTDTTVCIGCKACQVACHQWNALPAWTELSEYKPGGQHEGAPLPSKVALPVLSGNSYDNTGSLSAVNWRHVKFIEKFNEDRSQAAWLMMSDVCKHCVDAPCLEVCPTGAILRTEFDSVYINEPACNGCRDCVSACPFGVIHMSEKTHIAQKCTFCYDRLKVGLPPACAQACPTQSIRFGPVRELKKMAAARVDQLQADGRKGARLYGADDTILGGLNSFYLLEDEPEVYGLPSRPRLPSRNVPRSSLLSIFTGALAALGLLFAFRTRTRRPPAPVSAGPGPGPRAAPPGGGAAGGEQRVKPAETGGNVRKEEKP